MAITSRDILLSVVTGLLAWGLSVAWLPSLRLTPYAFLNGILLGLGLALLFLYSGSRRSFDQAQNGFAAPTSLSLSQADSWGADLAALRNRNQYERAPYDSIAAPLGGSLDGLLDLVVRDFVKSWYGKISTGQSFVNQVDRVVRLALDNIAAKLRDRDTVQLIVLRLLPIIDSHFQKFVEAELAVRGQHAGEDVRDAVEELDIAIAARFDGGRLHPAASVTGTNSESLQKQHLREIVAHLLPEVLPAALLSSGSVLVLVREIVSCAVLFPAMQLFTDPDFLNQQIENYGKAVLLQRKSVMKLRAAVDSAAALDAPTLVLDFPHLSPNDSENTFEQFIRAIRQCTVLHQARQIQIQIASQIEAASNTSGPDVTYLRRLEIGKRLLDQRIEQLSDLAAKTASSSKAQGDTKKTTVTLRDILYDTNGLAYIMEFMDRADKMIYVQFWIVVDGLRTPAERIFDNNIEEQRDWGEAERQIINKINSNYFWRPELNISSTAQAAVNDYLDAGDSAVPRQYNAARRAVLKAQSDVFRQMETNYFPAFKSSDLYEKSGFPAESPSDARLPARPGQSPIPSGAKSSSHTNKNVFPHKSPDLRRAIASSSDIHSETRKLDAGPVSRRSLDDQAPRPVARKALFDEPSEDIDPLSRSIASIDSDLESPLEMPITRAPFAGGTVRSALSELLDGNDENEASLEKGSMTSSQDLGSERGSLDIKRPVHSLEKPTLSSLGLLGTPSKRTVFTSDDLFGENEQLWEDEEGQGGDANADKDRKQDEEVKKASPGDLGLAETVKVLSVEINKLEAQQTVIRSLLSKAELTNNVPELRILRKSESSIQREIQRKEAQRQQYIVQESDNTLYGKASVSIKNVMLGTDQDGHEFALYVIEVTRSGEEHGTSSAADAAVWAIARRYSEFHDLHRRLRRRFPALRDTEFPRRQMVLTLQKDLLKKRRAALEKYLRELLKEPAICASFELRAFLSQQTLHRLQADSSEPHLDRKDLVSRIYNSVSDGMEEFLGNVPIIDQLSTAGQNLISAATAAPLSPSIQQTEQPEGQNAFMPTTIGNDPMSVAEARREQSALEAVENAGAASNTSAKKETTFIAPIASAFLTLFQLRTSTASAWLRGRAVIIVLQQLLGGTVERRVRETFTAATTASQLSKYVDQIRAAVWPQDGAMTAKNARTRKEKDASQTEASVVLAAILTDVAGGVIGRSVARDAGRRAARMIGNERILKGLSYRILDEVMDAIWNVKVK